MFVATFVVLLLLIGLFIWPGWARKPKAAAAEPSDSFPGPNLSGPWGERP